MREPQWGPAVHFGLHTLSAPPDRSSSMIISIDRRAEGAGGKEIKFEILVKPLDQYHTHGELTRCDQQAVRAALVQAADRIEQVLRETPAKR